MKAKPKSLAGTENLALLTRLVCGWCVNGEQEKALLAYGIPASQIFMKGRGADSLDALFDYYRGCPGRLVIAADLRVFGSTRPEIASVMKTLFNAKIGVSDILNMQDGDNPAAMMERATREILGVRFKDKRVARRQGSRGGQAKGIAAQAARDQIVRPDILARLVQHRDIPWRVKMEVLGDDFSMSSLRRHYLNS